MESKYFVYGTDFAPFVQEKRVGGLQLYKPPTSFEYDLPKGLTGREYVQHARKDKVYNIGGAVTQMTNTNFRPSMNMSGRDSSFDDLIKSQRLAGQLPRVVDEYAPKENYNFPGSRAQVIGNVNGVQQRTDALPLMAGEEWKEGRLVTNPVVPVNSTTLTGLVNGLLDLQK